MPPSYLRPGFLPSLLGQRQAAPQPDYSTPEGVSSYLASPEGSSLGAGDYNRLRDLHALLYNQRAAATPATPNNWGGLQSVNNAPDLNGLAQQIAQQHFSNRPVSYGRLGNELMVGGKPYTYDLAGDASNAGVSQDAYMQQAVKMMQAKQPEFSLDKAYKQAFASPLLQQLPGDQRAKVVAMASPYGQDYGEFQKSQMENMSNLEKLQLMRQKAKQDDELFGINKTKGLQDVYLTGAKTLGASNPEEIRTTYNADPAHPNQFRHRVQKFDDQGNPLGEGQDQWMYAQPESVKSWLSTGAPLGYSGDLSSDQNRAIQAAQARKLAQLEAERRAHFAAGDPAYAPAPTTGSTAARANDFRQNLGAGMDYNTDRVATFLQNKGRGLGNAMAGLENNVAGFFGANQDVEPYIEPLPAPRYEPPHPVTSNANLSLLQYLAGLRR